jgi:hypothetical protein
MDGCKGEIPIANEIPRRIVPPEGFEIVAPFMPPSDLP